MPLKIVFVLLVVYAVTAAPLFLPGELRVVVQPGTDDAAEVYYEAVSPVMLRSYEGTEPFNRAQLLAEQRAEAYPEDLAPPYIAHGATYRLVAPYVTARGRALAAPVLSGTYWSEGKQVRYDIVPEVRRARRGAVGPVRAGDRAPVMIGVPRGSSGGPGVRLLCLRGLVLAGRRGLGAP
ncbi:hypothetical protein GCM10022224_052480 [Nonomuraea antimicrobica]|uniref:SAF domain-containing protein n=1 Tax=Nonomuraea antimicrobica TaxID=561173 RepID=A0ABP7CBD1_9ACTN